MKNEEKLKLSEELVNWFYSKNIDKKDIRKVLSATYQKITKEIKKD